MKTVCTICFIFKDDKILLGMKKRGFGAGRWNGFGGKVQGGETIEQAAIRETVEEAGLEYFDAVLEKRGLLLFDFKNKDLQIEAHVFVSEGIAVDAKETEEMRPRWFGLKEIPYSEMWPDDIYWIPLMLSNKNFFGRFLFDENDNVLEYQVKETQ